MNYGEEIVYWYLRLNGFFPISNFVIHRSSKVEHSSDCDLLAVRTPHVFEEVGGQPEDWDKALAGALGFGRNAIGVICEVKTGRYSVDDIFRPAYVEYAAGRLGLVQRNRIPALTRTLNKRAVAEFTGNVCVCKLLVANGPQQQGPFLFVSLDSAEDFINDRVRRYPDHKYADRLYFGSELFQHTIHRIHREREQRRSEEPPHREHGR